MKMFFRPATDDDFKGYEVKYDHLNYMEDKIKELIEDGETHKAIKKLRENTGMGMVDAKRFCEQYEKYSQAKRDFKAGKDVFVSY